MCLKCIFYQWGMLQGDLKDWSALATGKMCMSNVAARRRGRRAREDMDEDTGEKKFEFGATSSGAHVEALDMTPKQAQVLLRGELTSTDDGKQVISVVPGEGA